MYEKIYLYCNTLIKLEQITWWLLEGQIEIKLGTEPTRAHS